ncbi:MAG TPA: histidine phosphatase family protein [Bacteroidales bacterium]|nr:histidine phosphatase family protein [Bacteroidales bacterium]
MSRHKTLHILRHAKSGWNSEGIADIDRPLKTRGVKSAYEISRKLKLQGLIPEQIISSPADRALHTAVIFARVFEINMENLQINNLLYESSSGKILDYIRKFSHDFDSVMIVGHNPDLTDLAGSLMKLPIEDIPTSGVVTLTFRCENWKKIDRDCLDSHQFTFPNIEE